MNDTFVKNTGINRSMMNASLKSLPTSSLSLAFWRHSMPYAVYTFRFLTSNIVACHEENRKFMIVLLLLSRWVKFVTLWH
jgi:hypothetical protein